MFYRKFKPTFWTGETGRSLRGHPEAQLLAFYLVNNLHSNMIGLYYLPLVLIAHEIGLTLEGASKGLQSLSEVGYAHYDEATEVVWVVNMAREQVGESLSPNDNKVKAVNKDYENAPKCAFLGAFYDKYAESFHLENRRESEASSKGLQRGFEGALKPESSKQLAVSSKQKEKKEKTIITISTTQELTTGEASPALENDDDDGEEVVISLPDKIPIEELKSLCRRSFACFAKAMPSAAVSELKRMRDSYRRDQIEHAFSEAAKSGATSLNYVSTVLKRMPHEGRLEDDPRYEAVVGKG